MTRASPSAPLRASAGQADALDRIASALERIADSLDNPRPVPNLAPIEVARLLGWQSDDQLRRAGFRATIEAPAPEGWGFPPPITVKPLRWDPAAIEAWRARRRGNDEVITIGAGNALDLDRLLDLRGDAVAGAARRDGRGRAA